MFILMGGIKVKKKPAIMVRQEGNPAVTSGEVSVEGVGGGHEKAILKPLSGLILRFYKASLRFYLDVHLTNIKELPPCQF